MTSVEITKTRAGVTAVATAYRWSWTRQDDRFTIADDHGTITAPRDLPRGQRHGKRHYSMVDER